jgi:DNA replication protein DnaC
MTRRMQQIVESDGAAGWVATSRRMADEAAARLIEQEARGEDFVPTYHRDRATAEPCSVCGGAGHVRRDRPDPWNHPDEYFPCPVCAERDAWGKREAARGKILPYGYGTYRFDTFTTKHDPDGRLGFALNMARRFAHEPSSWLYIHGPVGTGKTHLAAAVTNALIDRGVVVRFFTAIRLAEELRRAVGGNEHTAIAGGRAELEAVPVLIVDDFGTERVTDWLLEQWQELFNARYVAARPTIITTNVPARAVPYDRLASRFSDARLVLELDLNVADYRVTGGAA